MLFDDFKGMAKVCRDGKLEDEDMPQWTRKVIGNNGNQVLEDVEACNVFTKKIMWKGTDFLRHVVEERQKEPSPAEFVCEHCKLFLVEDFLWWVSTNHGERRKNNQYEWLVVWSVRATV